MIIADVRILMHNAWVISPLHTSFFILFFCVDLVAEPKGGVFFLTSDINENTCVDADETDASSIDDNHDDGHGGTVTTAAAVAATFLLYPGCCPFSNLKNQTCF